MEIMLRLRCTGCGKCFIVEDDQVETDYLSCPHCQDEIEVSDASGFSLLGTKMTELSDFTNQSGHSFYPTSWMTEVLSMRKPVILLRIRRVAELVRGA